MHTINISVCVRLVCNSRKNPIPPLQTNQTTLKINYEIKNGITLKSLLPRFIFVFFFIIILEWCSCESQHNKPQQQIRLLSFLRTTILHVSSRLHCFLGFILFGVPFFFFFLVLVLLLHSVVRITLWVLNSSFFVLCFFFFIFL